MSTKRELNHGGIRALKFSSVRDFELERGERHGRIEQRSADARYRMGLPGQPQRFSAIAMDDDDVRVLLAGFRQEMRTHFSRDVVDLWEFQRCIDEDGMNRRARTIANGFRAAV
jgi:hypothetical protein